MGSKLRFYKLSICVRCEPAAAITVAYCNMRRSAIMSQLADPRLELRDASTTTHFLLKSLALRKYLSSDDFVAKLLYHAHERVSTSMFVILWLIVLMGEVFIQFNFRKAILLSYTYCFSQENGMIRHR